MNINLTLIGQSIAFIFFAVFCMKFVWPPITGALANEIVEEAKGTAVQEGDRIKTAAHSDIQKEINRAKEQLRSQVSALAVAGAEKVLKKEINADAHKAVLDDLAAQI
mgnify:CR=1 FL=1